MQTSETVLIEKLKARDAGAYHYIIDHYGNYMLRLAYDPEHVLITEHTVKIWVSPEMAGGYILVNPTEGVD